MSFKSLLNKTCSWKRRLNVGINAYGEILYSDVTIASDVKCSRQVGRGYNARQMIERKPGDFNYQQVIYHMLPTDIQEDDIIKFEGSETERVRNIRDAAGRGHHLEIVVENIKETGEGDSRVG